MCTVTSSKRRETSLGKAKSIQLCDIRWVKPLQVLKLNSGYDSHDATSPSSFLILPPTSAIVLLQCVVIPNDTRQVFFQAPEPVKGNWGQCPQVSE